MTARSQVVMAVDAHGREWALKLPSAELAGNADELDRFAREEWVARRVDSPHVVRAHTRGRRPASLYVALEYVESSFPQLVADVNGGRCDVAMFAVGMLPARKEFQDYFARISNRPAAVRAREIDDALVPKASA